MSKHRIHLKHVCQSLHLDIHFSNACHASTRIINQLVSFQHIQVQMDTWTNMLSMDVYKLVEDVHSDGWMSTIEMLGQTLSDGMDVNTYNLQMLGQT